MSGGMSGGIHPGVRSAAASPEVAERLSPNQVHVWCAAVSGAQDPTLHARYGPLLSADERERYRRFRFEKDQRRYLTTRGLVRTVLSRLAPVDPTAWLFEANAYGRPAIANAQARSLDLRFSVSHTDQLVVLAVATGRDIGIDTEDTRRTAPLELADTFFSCKESAALRDLPADLRPGRFWELWTFKESYIKARGMGLSLPLDGFSFQFDDERLVDIGFAPAVPDVPHRWRFWQFRPNADHLLAVCLESGGNEPTELVFRAGDSMPPGRVLSCPPLRHSPPRA